MKRQRALVVGCGGFIGSHLLERLLSRGDYEVEGWDVSVSKIEPLLQHPQLHVRQSYIDGRTSPQDVESAVARADVVVSLAAVCNPAQYISDPVHTIHSNFTHAAPLVDLCARHAKWLVHVSTCEVYGRTLASSVSPGEYGDPRLYVQSEDTTPLLMGPTTHSRWCYATAKALLEHYVLAHARSSGMPFTIVRPYNWFGPRMDFVPGHDGEGTPRVLACFASALLNRTPMQLVDGGTAYRTITYIDDAISALERILDRPSMARNQIFNIAQPDGEIRVVL